MARLIETDSLSNQNISSALEIGAHTADATRLLFVRVLIDQAAGNGDYTVYATLQVNGAGSSYRLIPITTAAAASGITALGFLSIGIPVDSGDIVKVFIVGLAGDTTTPDTSVKFYENDYLRPTTTDRTLDVSSTGEAGVDWANVGSPTTTVTLSGTTVKTATDVETDTQDIQSRLPAALSSGNMKVDVFAISTDATAADNAEAFVDGNGYAGTGNTIPNVTTVNGLAANVITAAAIATGAIDADAIADNAIDAGAIAADAITAAKIADSAITANKIAADAITAAKIATNAIDADAIAADAVAEIQSGLSTLNAAGVRSAIGMASADLDTQLDAIAAASAPSESEIADAVWDELLSGHVVSGSAGEALSNSGAAATPPTVGAIADAVWDEALAGHVATGTTGVALQLASGSGGGAVLTSFTINDQAGNPLDGVLVEISTDEEKDNVIASGYTLTNGIVQLNLDPGDYFLWKNRGGYDFENPEEITVS